MTVRITKPEINIREKFSQLDRDTSVAMGGGLAVGGTVTEYISGGKTYRVHSFTTNSEFALIGTKSVDFLVLAGGGGSAAAEGQQGASGGAGAGGMVVATSQTITFWQLPDSCWCWWCNWVFRCF